MENNRVKTIYKVETLGCLNEPRERKFLDQCS